MFGTIASRYDLVNHIISFNIDKRWRKNASRLISDDNPLKILDVACGTADLTIEMHRHMPEAFITGIDISDEMLEIGRRKVRRLNACSSPPDAEPMLNDGSYNLTGQDGYIGKITLKHGDALNIHTESETFDRVTIAFGIRNIKERHRAIREFYRVLKKGGKLMVLEFSIPEKGVFSIIYKMYFNYVLPYLGGITSGNFKAYRYFVRSVYEFPVPEKFACMLSECGFRVDRVIPLTGGAAWIYLASRTDK